MIHTKLLLFYNSFLNLCHAGIKLISSTFSLWSLRLMFCGWSLGSYRSINVIYLNLETFACLCLLCFVFRHFKVGSSSSRPTCFCSWGRVHSHIVRQITLVWFYLSTKGLNRLCSIVWPSYGISNFIFFSAFVTAGRCLEFCPQGELFSLVVC